LNEACGLYVEEVSFALWVESRAIEKIAMSEMGGLQSGVHKNQSASRLSLSAFGVMVIIIIGVTSLFLSINVHCGCLVFIVVVVSIITCGASFHCQ